MNNSQARKLGERIKAEAISNEKPTRGLLEEIQEFRKGFQESGAQVFDILSSVSHRIRNDRIVTFRLKRIETIINKLKREPHMELDRMWDIGGCRCILETKGAVLALRKALHERLTVRKENDYLDGKQNGYRALHLYVECPTTKRIVEIQLRTKQHHNWATLVEIVDLIYNKQLKFGEKDTEFDKFFQLLSKLNNLNYEEMHELITIENQQKLISRISEIFSRNFIKVRQNWLSLEQKPSHNYFVIEVDSNRLPTIQSFDIYSEAEETYFERFLAIDNNVVLTHLINPNYKQICMAYSNYILTSHRFIDDYYKIMDRLLNHLVANKSEELFKECFTIFRENYKIEQSTMSKEIEELKLNFGNKAFYNSKMKEWVLEIEERLNNRKAFFEEKLALNKPRGKLSRFIKTIFTNRD